MVQCPRFLVYLLVFSCSYYKDMYQGILIGTCWGHSVLWLFFFRFSFFTHKHYPICSTSQMMMMMMVHRARSNTSLSWTSRQLVLAALNLKVTHSKYNASWRVIVRPSVHSLVSLLQFTVSTKMYLENNDGICFRYYNATKGEILKWLELKYFGLIPKYKNIC